MGVNPLQVLNSSPNSRVGGESVSTSDDEADSDGCFIRENARNNLSGEGAGAYGQVAFGVNPCGPVSLALK